MSTAIISKISMKTIKANPAKFASPEGTSIALVYGEASDIKEVVDKARGDVYRALTGNFEARNVATGETFQSSILYLPGGIHEMLENGVKKLQTEFESVRFALDIRAVTASSPAGYSYEAVNMLKPAVTDPLTAIRQEIGAGPKVEALPESTDDGPEEIEEHEVEAVPVGKGKKK